MIRQRKVKTMTIRPIPEIRAFAPLDGVEWEPPGEALSRWHDGVRSAHEGDGNVIEIFDVIGEDFWTGGGWTARRVSQALQDFGGGEVIVNINSPGGDFFEGVAIYNLFREHPGRVDVKVMGLAASAASVIAMAGDSIAMPKAGFMMIHNAWGVVMGNRHDLTKAAETLAPFDDAMAAVYADRAEVDKAQAAAWMDDEKWFNGEQAVEAGLADSLLSSDEVVSDPADDAQAKHKQALRAVERALADKGKSRSERRALLAELQGGKPGAAPTAKPGAGVTEADIRSLIKTLRS